jgi:hypothetical protein
MLIFSILNYIQLKFSKHSIPTYIFILGQTVTTVGEEKAYNPRLTKSLDEFIEIMNNLNLAYPKRIG